MFHSRSALDVVLWAAGALWLMLSAGSGSVPHAEPFLVGDLHDWRLINCLGCECHYSAFPVINRWPAGCVLSLSWRMLG